MGQSLTSGSDRNHSITLTPALIWPTKNTPVRLCFSHVEQCLIRLCNEDRGRAGFAPPQMKLSFSIVIQVSKQINWFTLHNDKCCAPSIGRYQILLLGIKKKKKKSHFFTVITVQSITVVSCLLCLSEDGWKSLVTNTCGKTYKFASLACLIYFVFIKNTSTVHSLQKVAMQK